MSKIKDKAIDVTGQADGQCLWGNGENWNRLPMMQSVVWTGLTSGTASPVQLDPELYASVSSSQTRETAGRQGQKTHFLLVRITLYLTKKCNLEIQQE